MSEVLYILNNDFFNSFTGAYRPYIKLTQPILDKHYIHTRQWLILRDIANFQPTTLVKISHRHSIEKPTARKIIKVLLDNKWIIAEPGADKREKLLSLTHSGRTLFEIINQEIIQKAGLTDIQLSETIDIMSQIHETLNREETE